MEKNRVVSLVMGEPIFREQTQRPAETLTIEAHAHAVVAMPGVLLAPLVRRENREQRRARKFR